MSIVDVHVILRRDGRILLGRRANTGFGDGLLHLPSGHLEDGESVTTAAVREAAEEIDVVIDPADLIFAHAMHRAGERLPGRRSLPGRRWRRAARSAVGAARSAVSEPPGVQSVSDDGPDRVGFFFLVDRWRGEPRNNEPDRCSELVWLDPADLPPDVIAYPAAALRAALAQVPYSEFGWVAPAGGTGRGDSAAPG